MWKFAYFFLTSGSVMYSMAFTLLSDVLLTMLSAGTQLEANSSAPFGLSFLIRLERETLHSLLSKLHTTS